MDKSEAQKILGEHLARFSSRSHGELAPLVESQHVEAFEVGGESGTAYQIELQLVWDNRRGGTIRIIGSIDDGGVRAYFPLTDSLLVTQADSWRSMRDTPPNTARRQPATEVLPY